MSQHWRFNRRRLGRLGLATLAGIGGTTIGSWLTKSQNYFFSGIPTPDVPPSETPFESTPKPSGGEPAIAENAPLVERATVKELIYGSAARYPDLSTDSQYATALGRECGLLVPVNELKWASLRPKPDEFNFTQADWMLAFAQNHNMLFRGHTLVWEQSLPVWFEETVNRQNAEQVLEEHITTVVSHYAGQMHSWDVVNEAISLSSNRPDRLRSSPWLRFLGEDYIDLAFRLAAAADPNALLVYNDNAMDHTTSNAAQKRIAVLNLLERLKSLGTPIHALGIQGHLFRNPEENQFNATELSQFLSDVASLGLKIMITELDVTDRHLPAAVDVRDRRVAGAYEDYLSIVLEQPAVIAVITWGLSDRYTWLEQFRPREDGLPTRPLPLDRDLNRKPAWNAIARAFDAAPSRSIES